MKVIKIGAVVLETSVNVFIGKNTNKMFINHDFVCSKDNLIGKYRFITIYHYEKYVGF